MLRNETFPFLSFCFAFRLAEVGRLEPAKSDGKYETGQLFLHRIFGYRGVVLFPWTARVYDRDLQNPNKAKTPSPANVSSNNSTQSQTTKSKNDAIESATKSNEKLSHKPTSADSSLKSQVTDEVSSSKDAVVAGAQSKSKPLKSDNIKTNSTGAANNNSSSTSDQSSSTESQENLNNKEVKGKDHTFYQVLIDSRDCPYIVRLNYKYLSSFQFNFTNTFLARSNRSGYIFG